ncbi:glycosyl hydrolase family 95 catalytic domain-containing protein [Pseudactinotalea sp.]|uniref:glycoside hydrolase family 95 protein n=1 Tax=Pseudactinotalea sp. TaxID=1926260 RepID=UPI003B3BD88E
MTSDEAAPRTDDVLWWQRAPDDWLSAIPLGNGRLGAKVHGRAVTERIALNLDTLWSGGPQQHSIVGGPAVVDELRRLLFAGGARAEADRLARTLEGPDVEAFQPAGDLEITDLSARADTRIIDYRTELDMSTGVATTRYGHAATALRRTIYVSYPDDCLVARIDALQGSLHLGIRLTSPHPTVSSMGPLTIQGYAPAWVDGAACLFREPQDPPARYGDHGGVGFVLGLDVDADGGEVIREEDRLVVCGASSVTIRLAGGTTFQDWRTPASRDLRPVRARVAGLLAAAAARSEPDLAQRHIADHRALYERAELRLDSPVSRDDLPIDERIALVRDGGSDPGLIADLFAFGRYLLIASSRPETQPAHLQGIWNESITPPWFADWTTNINLQMNYWVAEVGALPECVEPLIGLVEDLAEAGRVTAREVFGFDGWCVNHNVDIWRTSWPVGEGLNTPKASLTPTCGMWILAQAVEHERFDPDETFARDRLLPLVEGAVAFALDLLVPHPTTGHLVTAPSTSPENEFLDVDDVVASVDYGSTFDLWLIRDLLTGYLHLGERLRVALSRADDAARALSLLPAVPLGSDGRIQEWATPWREAEPGHRHLSHLYGLYPGDGIDLIETPELAAAAQRTLDVKATHGHPVNGWPHAWAVALRARLADAETCNALLENLVRTDKIGRGLLYISSRGIFQIDANLGVSAAIAEMLLQSHRGTIRVLPALPRSWERGCFRGLRARGGVSVSARWSPGEVDIELTAQDDGVHSVLVPGADEPELVHLRSGVRTGWSWRRGAQASSRGPA